MKNNFKVIPDRFVFPSKIGCELSIGKRDTYAEWNIYSAIPVDYLFAKQHLHFHMIKNSIKDKLSVIVRDHLAVYPNKTWNRHLKADTIESS